MSDSEFLRVLPSGSGSSGAGTTQLFERHRSRLRRLVMLRMHPKMRARVDPSDVLQDTFIEFARRLSRQQVEPKIPLFLWLRMLATQRLDQLQRMHLGAEKRTASREQGLAVGLQGDASVLNLAASLAGHFTSVDRNLIRAEVHQKLLNALEVMESNDREIVAMRHFEELSTEEIAQVLGLTRSGVLKRYARAIRRLRSSVTGDSALCDFPS